MYKSIRSYLGTAAVTAIAKAHDEGLLERKWLISGETNAEVLNGLFQQRNHDMTLRFGVDGTTVSIITGRKGDSSIKTESHR